MRVILADDARLFRQGLALLLKAEGFTVVAEADDADGLPERVAAEEADVVIVDIRMPPTFTVEGLRAALAIKQRHPGVGVLVLSQHVESRYALKLLSQGAGGVGYLLKERVTDATELAEAVRRVGGGGSSVDPTSSSGCSSASAARRRSTASRPASAKSSRSWPRAVRTIRSPRSCS